MNVVYLSLAGFTAHENTSIDLPDRGVVVIVGPNGSGKSSLVEAASYAGWGRTLRGTDPWVPGKAGSVVMECAAGGTGLSVVWRRTPAGGKTVGFGTGAEDCPTYENNTKTLEALEQILGPWEVWRRTRVFSSADAAHFSASTDAERKRLVEEILGLSRYDRAQGLCTAARKAAAELLSAARAAQAVAQERERGAARLSSAAQEVLVQALPPPVDAAALVEKCAQLMKLSSAAQDDTDLSRAENQRLNGELRVLERADEDALRKLRVAETSGGVCSARCGHACGHPTDAQLAELRAEHAAGKAVRAAERSALRTRAEVQAERIREGMEESSALSAAAAKARHEAGSATQATARRAYAQQQMDAAQVELAAAELAVKLAGEDLAATSGKVEVLEHVAVVLGMKGVRAHVLGQALGGLEAGATYWLSRLSGDLMRIRVSAYTEKKSGGLSDAISIQVAPGAGDFRAYDSLSGGERRRVDVSLMLALGDVAAAAHAQGPGTTFVDEAFDALDAAGTRAVCGVVEDLGRDRCVVVITHSEELAAAIRADLRLRVDAGKLLR